MQSESVLDLLLNFSAMEFVSLVDDVTFAISTEGFFGLMMKEMATTLTVMQYFVGSETAATFSIMGRYQIRKSSLLSATYFFILFAAMMTGWGVIFAKQSAGIYTCGKIFVQFDDALDPYLGIVAGLYQRNRYITYGGRVSYWATSGSGGIIGYCKKYDRWTLTTSINSETGDNSQFDPCKSWIVASSHNEEYDVTKTAGGEWYINTSLGRILPLDYTYIQCYDCQYKSNVCGEYLEHGMCQDNQCICNPSRYGLRCDFEQPCTVLEIDPRSEGFTDLNNKTFASKYYYTPPNPFDNERHHRPMYLSAPNGKSNDKNLDAIVFTGRRWVVTNTDMMPRLVYPWYIDNASTYEVSFVSEAVDIDSGTDLVAYPRALQWYVAVPPGFAEYIQRTTSDEFYVYFVCTNGSASEIPFF